MSLLRSALLAGLFTLLPMTFADAYGESTKRGFAGGGINNTLATNADWFYHWGLDKPSGEYDANFVPMFWGNVTQAGINKVLGYGDTTHVLGFNEPERTDQANLSVANAISKWQTLEAGLNGSGIKLVSPAVSDNGAGQQWLSAFMGQADNLGLQVDAVAFHWYGVNNPNNPVAAANQLLGRVDSYHNTYGKPVWLTEFALHDWGGNYSDEVMREANRIFLDTVIPGLESRSYVDGYSFYQWFGDAMLIEGNPTTPTVVGDAYIPSIKAGETLDLQGASQGDDRIYLKGGSVINSGPVASGAVRYLDAISGTSTLGGTTDWGIASPGWATIRSEATVRKEGTNKIHVTGITFSSSGLLEFANGVTSFDGGAALIGTGTTKVLPSANVELGVATDRAGVAWAQIAELHGGRITANSIRDGVHRLDNVATIHATSTFSGDGVLLVNGPMLAPPGLRGGGIIKDGAGELVLNAANTYRGNTIVKRGTLELGSSGSISETPYIEVHDEATLDVSAHASGYALNDQTLVLLGAVNGSLQASQGSTITVQRSTGSIVGNLSVQDATVQLGGVGFTESPQRASKITTNLQLEYDAGSDTSGDALWFDATGSGQNLDFDGIATASLINDASVPGITHAYHIPNSGAAHGLTQFFDSGEPRSEQDATFEVWFHVASTDTVGSQAIFEVGATRGLSFTMDGDTLSFNVDGDGSLLTLSENLTTGWHQAVGVVDLVGTNDDLANDSMSLYIDGQLVDSLTNVLIDDWAGGNPGGIGGNASGTAGSAANDFHSQIAIARFYSDLAFSAADVDNNYQGIVGSGIVLPTTMHVNGDYFQSSSGILKIDLLDELTHDSLEITGTADLAGELSVAEISGFIAEFGDEFEILTATGGITGEFETLELPTLATGKMFKAVYSPNAVSLRVVGSMADFDFDGDVDHADLAIWQASFGTSAGGDADGDGDTDGEDILLWQREFAASGGGVLQSVAIPEPNSLILLLVAMLPLTLQQRVRSKLYKKKSFVLQYSV